VNLKLAESKEIGKTSLAEIKGLRGWLDGAQHVPNSLYGYENPMG
jgi:hypothetical protein